MMVAKTERFEMRLDPSTLQRLDDWREELDDQPSRSEAVRRLVENGLSARSAGPFVMDDNQRLQTWLLTEILKHQKGYPEQDTVDLIQKAIFGGHFWALKWEMVGVLHDHTDKDYELKLVVDTMDMWSFIEPAYAALSKADKELIEKKVGSWAKNPKFAGFDGNHEGTYCGIARFLVEQMGRFERFKGRDFNSHSPKVERSRRMIEVFEPIRAKLVGRMLSADELVEILKV